MEDYQARSEAVATSETNQPVAVKTARQKTAARKSSTTKAGARGKKPAPPQKKKPSEGTRGIPKQAKGKPAGGRIRSIN